jgi:response regulator NasT
MSVDKPTPSFIGWRALVVHKPHANVDAVMLQLERIGVTGRQCWPDTTEIGDVYAFNVMLIDADMGYDGQFPWRPGEAPMPTIGLIGSEAPGRISWAMSQGADAQLLKPIGSAGVYSALVIACHAFAQRSALTAEIASLRKRLGAREVVAEATALLMVRDNVSAQTAFQQLRLMAMAGRETLEDAAACLLAGLDQRKAQ